MLYQLDRRLFLENGPTAFADTARRARATSETYRLLRPSLAAPASALATLASPDERCLSAAA